MALHVLPLLTTLILHCSGPTIPSASASALDDVSGQALVMPPPTGAWTSYQLTVCPVDAPAACVPGVPACAVVSPGPATCAIPGLQPATEYTVSAVAQATGSPDSQPSANVTFTTRISAPTLAAAATGPHNASLTVTPPTAGGPFAQYNITVCIFASSSDCFQAQCTASGAAPCTLDVGAASCLAPATNCLRAETQYSAKATATSQAGTVSLASTPASTFTTPSHSGPTIQSASAVDDASGQALVMPPPTGAWTSYQLTVCPVDAPTACVPGVPACAVVSPGPATCAIPGLQPATEYTVSAVAQATGSPDSQPSDNASFITIPPPAVATLAVSNTATSTALAVTAPSGYTHTDFAKYALEVCPGGTRTGCTSVDCLPADAAACRVSGLTPSTTYDIRVAAVKSGVAGAWSSTVATTTTCASSCPEYTTCPDSGVGCVCNRDNAIVSGPYIDYVADPRPAYQSSQFSFDPSRTVATYAVNGKVDDDYNVNGIQSTDYGDYYPWWFVDLGEGAMVTGIQVYNRYDCCADRLVDMEFRIGDADPTVPMGSLITANPLLVKYPGPPVLGNGQVVLTYNCTGTGRYLSLQKLTGPVGTFGKYLLNVAEVRVYGTPGKLASPLLAATYATNSGAVIKLSAPYGYTHASFEKYVLEVCPSGANNGCTSVDCPPANADACPVPNLSASSSYEIKGAVVRNGQTGSWTTNPLAIETCSSSCASYQTCDNGVGCICAASGATISTGAVISLNRPAGQSTTDGPYTATLAVDSVMTSFQSTALSGDTKPYWYVDLGAGAQVTGIQIASRDNCCQGRISDLEVRLGDSDPSSTATNTPIAVNSVYAKYAGPPGTSGQQVLTFNCTGTGRYLSIQRLPAPGADAPLNMADVKVYGTVGT